MLNACIYNLRACISEGGDLLFIEIFTCSFDVTGFKDRFDGAQLLGAAQGNDGIELLGVDALSFACSLLGMGPLLGIFISTKNFRK